MKNWVLAVEFFLRDEEGATAVEYVIMASLVAAVIVVIIFFVGLQVVDIFNKFCISIQNLVGGACS